MRVVVVVESMFGATLRLAQMVAAGAAAEGAVCDVLEVGSAGWRFPDERDLVVLGCPTHLRRTSTERSRAAAAKDGPVVSSTGVDDWLGTVTLGDGDRVAVFDTKVAGIGAGSAARALAKRLRRAGVQLVGEPTSFVVGGRHDGPVDGEDDRAFAWGASLVAVGQKTQA